MSIIDKIGISMTILWFVVWIGWATDILDDIRWISWGTSIFVLGAACVLLVKIWT